MKLSFSCPLILGVTLSLAQNVIAAEHLRGLQGNGNRPGRGNGNNGGNNSGNNGNAGRPNAGNSNNNNNKEDREVWGGLGTRVYDCEIGCDLDGIRYGPQVCGKDGITYFNECLAVCQGVEVERRGTCRGQVDSAVLQSDASYQREGRVSKANMDAFKAENLRFVAPRRLDRTLRPPKDEPVAEDTTTATAATAATTGATFAGMTAGQMIFPDDSNKPGANDGKGDGNGDEELVPEYVEVKRITRDGYEYAGRFKFADLPVTTATKPTDGVLGRYPSPHAHNITIAESPEMITIAERGGGRGQHHGRRLTILGDDTRSEVTAWDYPNWRLGELEYDNAGGCSGAIVGSNAVLTAAHCVYQAFSGQWMVPDKFAPGRHRSGSSYWDPWGHWSVSYATIFTPYFNSGDTNYDIAVLKIGPGSAHSTPIGDYMGTLGMKVQPCTGSYIESSMRIIGYPGEQIDGSMWTSGQCEDWDYICGSKRIQHKCDTTGGMSGSPILDGDNTIVGVHTMGTMISSDPAYNWNSGKAITSADLGALQNVAATF